MNFEEKVQNVNKNIQKYETKHCFDVLQNNSRLFFSYFHIFFSFEKQSKLSKTVTSFVQFRILRS